MPWRRGRPQQGRQGPRRGECRPRSLAPGQGQDALPAQRPEDGRHCTESRVQAMTVATTAPAVTPLGAALTALQSSATIVSAIYTLIAQHKGAVDTAVAGR